MRNLYYLSVLSFLLISCTEEEVVFGNPYQLELNWLGQGYGLGTKDHLWTKKVDLNNEILLDINVDYGPNANSNFKIFDIDITKLSDTTNVKVILTFDCDTATIRHELYGVVRDGIPDYFDIKKEVLINFYKDKRTVILVEASPVCNPEISVFYE
jgi:hypothetical protein|tara:strand:- start:954 stop:1418 length:465 start_codon:yes stop_codon:yes gene_type:complete